MEERESEVGETRVSACVSCPAHELTLTRMRRTQSTEMAATMYVTICRVMTGKVVGDDGPSAFGAVIKAV